MIGASLYPLSVLIPDHLQKYLNLEQMPAEPLVPGYKLVECFGPDSEYETRPSADSRENEGEEEVEEEVEYVTLEISGIADVDSNLLTSYRLIVSSQRLMRPSLPLDSLGVLFYVLEGIQSADLDLFPLFLRLFPAFYSFTIRLICRAWTRQRLSSNSQVLERSLKDVTINSLAPNSYSHMPRVSNKEYSHDHHPFATPTPALRHTHSSILPRSQITNSEVITPQTFHPLLGMYR